MAEIYIFTSRDVSLYQKSPKYGKLQNLYAKKLTMYSERYTN